MLLGILSLKRLYYCCYYKNFQSRLDTPSIRMLTTSLQLVNNDILASIAPFESIHQVWQTWSNSILRKVCGQKWTKCIWSKVPVLPKKDFLFTCVWYKKFQKLKITKFSSPTKFTYQQRNVLHLFLYLRVY